MQWDGRGAESDDRKKAWPSVNHSIPEGSILLPPLPRGTQVNCMRIAAWCSLLLTTEPNGCSYLFRGLAYGSVNQRYGSADPDLAPDRDQYQNVTDLEHAGSAWCNVYLFMQYLKC